MLKKIQDLSPGDVIEVYHVLFIILNVQELRDSYGVYYYVNIFNENAGIRTLQRFEGDTFEILSSKTSV